jgi:hypothetical protein
VHGGYLDLNSLSLGIFPFLVNLFKELVLVLQKLIEVSLLITGVSDELRVEGAAFKVLILDCVLLFQELSSLLVFILHDSISEIFFIKLFLDGLNMREYLHYVLVS